MLIYVTSDGKDCVAILYAKGSKYANYLMKKYTENTSTCRCRLLFEGFLSYNGSEIKVAGCKCCDLCRTKYTCKQCEGSH